MMCEKANQGEQAGNKAGSRENACHGHLCTPGDTRCSVSKWWVTCMHFKLLFFYIRAQIGCFIIGLHCLLSVSWEQIQSNYILRPTSTPHTYAKNVWILLWSLLGICCNSKQGGLNTKSPSLVAWYLEMLYLYRAVVITSQAGQSRWLAFFPRQSGYTCASYDHSKSPVLTLALALPPVVVLSSQIHKMSRVLKRVKIWQFLGQVL